MAFETSGQHARGFVQSLWPLLLTAALADIGADNSLSAPLPTLDPRRIIYKPHGIQFGRPGSAPLPARRNMPNPNRPQPYGLPKLPMGRERSPLSKILGPRGYIRPQEGFAPHPAMRFDRRLPNIPGFPSGYQDPHDIGPYRASDPRSFGVHGSRIAEPQVAPGYQGSRDTGLQQALGPNPFATQGPPQLSGPAYPPGYQPHFEPTFPPMNPWFGLPVPTPLGPYSQRRPVRPLPVPADSPLTPLRDLEDHGHDGVRSSESVEWNPVDTWQGAARDKVPRPPKPGDLQAMLPPALRVRRPKGKQAEAEGAVGYVYSEEEDSMPEYSEEKGYVTTKPTSLSPQHVTRGLARSTPAATPPPLLDNDALLNYDRPQDDEPSSEAEWFSNVAPENRNAEWFNETKNENAEGFRLSDRPSGQRRERPNSFDHLLLM